MQFENAVNYFQNFVEGNRDNHGAATAYGSKKSRLMRYWATLRLPYLVGDTWEDSTVLDVGCGPGHFLEWMQKTIHDTIRYEGVDITKGMIDLAVEKGLGEYIHQGTVSDARMAMYDWVVGNGPFGIAYGVDFDDSWEKCVGVLDSMQNKAKKGVAVDFLRGNNVLSDSRNVKHCETEREFLVDPLLAIAWAESKGLRWIVDTSTSWRFFTLYLYKGDNLFESRDDDFFEKSVFA